MSMFRSRVAALGLTVTTVLAAGSVSLLAQEPDAEKPTSASTLGRRVPPGFSKVGISTEQKERIYTIRAKHQAKIVELKRQIDSITAQELAECEAVLTDAQRKLLEQVRTAPRGKAKARANQQ